MMRFYVASLVIGVLTWGATPPATLTVDVGTEFAVRYEINPEIVQITVDGEPVGSQVPPGPYVWEYKYDKGLIQFTRSDASVTTTYREIEGTPWAVLKCESAEPVGHVYFRALRTTPSEVKLPIQNASAGGAALTVDNPDLLKIQPQVASITIRLEVVMP